MNKLFLTLVGVGSILCASPAMAHKASIHDPPSARKHHHHYHHPKHRAPRYYRVPKHNHCHNHVRLGYSHCHKHGHGGPGRGHHGVPYYHGTFRPLTFELQFY